ncbi:sulfatase-like hydrolase/transferase [Flammeovirgaceae bacterium KN852]|uniref:Sulfatase-like hydrolase/transferase n=1 Tax=Marinigracilibium pacificum TaxID=2729599 RepID=A0A848IWC7_9BACT|nr:sulfatase-like hydrolase/transferase [Marinigracilibium pacificum]
MIMADDLGYGDVGFNGNDIVKTPELDQMAAESLVMDRFYAAAPICSPTRASVLTGRNAFRQGIFAPHTAGMRVGETTLAEVLKEEGYKTGIFGKWHLGWIMPDAELDTRGFYSPPWHHGFEESFVTKSAMPTWNPSVTPWDIWNNKEGEMWTTSVYLENKVLVKDNLAGDDSRVIMDRVIPFIERSVDQNKPFFSCIWLHTPHEPVVAGPEYKAMYEGMSEDAKNYYGTITAMDEQIGRLRRKLKELNIDRKTIVWFFSDNGPNKEFVEKGVASAGKFRGTKHTIYEGGLRVPSLIEWPGKIQPNRTDAMSVTSDIMPTLLELINSGYTSEVPLDGISLRPLVLNENSLQDRYIAFGYMRRWDNTNQLAIMNDNYKLVIDGDKKELYDLKNDPEETKNLKDTKPDIYDMLLQELTRWQDSARMSREGSDYKY